MANYQWEIDINITDVWIATMSSLPTLSSEEQERDKGKILSSSLSSGVEILVTVSDVWNQEMYLKKSANHGRVSHQ